ncbi:hypothetical protein D3C75_510770 [compost metagenome]
MSFVGKVVAHLSGIVVQEVDRFADFGDGVTEGFTCFAYQNANQLLHLIFHQHRSAFQDRRTLLWRGGEPDWGVVHRAVKRQLHFLLAGFPRIADHIFRLGRVNHRQHVAVGHRLLEDR